MADSGTPGRGEKDSTHRTVATDPDGGGIPERAPSLRSSRPPPAPPLPSRPPPPPPPRASSISSPGTSRAPGALGPEERKARELIEACEAELATKPEPRRTARLHFEMGRLHESPLADLRRAGAHYQQALSLSPEHLPTLRAARRVMLERKSYPSAIPLFDAEARITADPRRKAALFLAKGRLLEDVLSRKEAAREAYSTALELDRGNRSVLTALEQRFTDARDWEALDRAYERSANAVSDDAVQRAALSIRRAWLLESRLEDPEGATELYQAALRLDPSAAVAISALKRLLHAQRRWRDLIAVLELEAERTSDTAVRTMDLYRIGMLHAERLGNREEALSAIERAHQESPEDPLILSALVRLYDSTARYEALVAALRSLAQLTEDPEERLGILHRLGQLCEERLKRDDEAVSWYEAALSVHPASVPTLQALGALYSHMSRWEDLIRMHQGEADCADEPHRRAAAHARIAEILEARLERPSDAIDQHTRALTVVPGYPPSFKALCRLLADAGRARELVELYERAVDRAQHRGESITYLFKIGAVHEDMLREHGHAAHTYKRVLELDPAHLGAIYALQRATERAGRYRELVEALELELERSRDGANVVALLHRIGEVHHEKLGDREAALSTFRKVLEIDSRYVPALSSLGRLYYRAGRWEDLLEIYQRELEVTPESPAAVTLLHKMGELCRDRIGRDEEAIAYYRRALEVDATHGPTLSALTRKLSERGDWRELVEVLELELAARTEPAARARAAFRLGEVLEERLSEPQRAVRAYTQALKAAPDYHPATDALARLRADMGTWSLMVQDLDREAETSTDPALISAAKLRQAAIWIDELNEPAKAVEAARAALAADPENAGALLMLERLLRKMGNWDELARVYLVQARVLHDLDTRVAALRELARLQETRGVGRPDDRIGTYEELLRLQPGDGSALAALERMALSSDDRGALLGVVRRLAENADDAEVLATHRTRLGELLEEDDADAAIEAFRSALAADPESLGATRGLSRLAERLDDPVALAEAARREAAVAHDGKKASLLLVKSAEVRARRLGDVVGAANDLERALELWPDSAEAASQLHLLHAGDEARLADVLARAAGSARDATRRAELWVDVAELQSERLDNLAGAISSLNRALRAVPDHVDCVQRLARLYERDGQWNEAVQLLNRLIKLGPEREVLCDAHLQLADLWAMHLGDDARAQVGLQAALALQPEHRGALIRLVELHEREGRIDVAVSSALKLLEASDESTLRADALVRLARLHRVADREEEARAELARAVGLEGPLGESALELKSMCVTASHHEIYARALSTYLASSETIAGSVPTYAELARVQQDELRQPETAIATLREAVTKTHDHPDIRRALAQRLRAAGHADQTIVELNALIEEDVIRADDWRELMWTYGELGRPIAARIAGSALLVLGDAQPRDLETIAASPPRPGHAAPATLQPESFAALEPSDAGHKAAARLLAALEPAMGKLYPVDLETFGLSNRDRITSRSDHPVRLLFDRIAGIVGAGDVGLFFHRVRTQGVVVDMMSSGPVVLVPSNLGELPLGQQVFLLAEPLLDIARHYYPMDRLTPREMQVLLASAARMVQSGYGDGLTSEDFLNEQSRRIHRALSRRHRKAAEAAARDYIAAPRVVFAKWYQAVASTTRCIAALLADDIDGVVEVMQREKPELARHEGIALVQSSKELRELLAYWASRDAMALRERAGLSS